MSLKSRTVVTRAKIETTYATDAAPTGVDAIVTSEVKLTPFAAGKVALKRDRQGFGNDQQIHVGIHAMIEFDVEFVGSGTLGTAPAWGKLMKACQHNETIVATTSVRYRPDQTVTDSLTIIFDMDGQQHKMLGCRGSFSLKIDAQGIPYLSFKFWGLYVDPVAAAMPTGLTGWNAFQTPVPVTFAHTPGMTVDTYLTQMISFQFDQGNKVSFYDNPGEQLVEITDRESSGSLVALAPPLGTKNYFTVAKNNSLVGIKVDHGQVSANKVIFESIARSQLTDPKYGDNDGRATIEMGFVCVPGTAGNDDYEIRLAAT